MERIVPLGDQALIVTFGMHPSEQLSSKIAHFCTLLESEKIASITEWVPTYLTVTIYYDPYIMDFIQLKEIVENLYARANSKKNKKRRTIHIPVCYEEPFGIDLEEVATYHKLTKEEVVQIHTEPKYFIYMLGFSPGFPYLGGLNPKIATPRKASPRLKVDAGSVGIAGNQTGIYSIDSPGGWQIIGRTPLVLFDPSKQHPVLLKAFDYLKFEPITIADYRKIKDEVAKGIYELQIDWEEA